MSIRHENVPMSCADDFHRSVNDELNRARPRRQELLAAQLELVRVAGKWALIVLTAAAVVLLLGIAFLEGLARAEARPPACDGLTGAECAAAVVEGAQR